MSTFSDPIAHLQEPLIFRQNEPFAFLFDFSGNTPVINLSTWVPKLDICQKDGTVVKSINSSKFSKPNTEQLLLNLLEADLGTDMIWGCEYKFKLRIETDQPERTFIDGIFKMIR